MLHSSDPSIMMRRRSGRRTSSGARWWATALAGAVGAVLLGCPTSALAQQYPPSASTLSVSDTTLDPGGETTIGADGYAPNTAVTVTFESEPVTIARLQANSTGAFTAQVRIPADATPGQHTIKATGLAPDGNMRIASTAVTVSGTSAVSSSDGRSAASGPQKSTRSRGIALTGLETFMLSAVGAGVLATGVVLVVLTRRRRSEGRPTA